MTQTHAIKLDTFQKARAQMLIKHPFFAAIVLSTEWVVREDIPTMATDMVKVYYNPVFANALSVEQCMFVMCHEIMHMILMHGLRMGSRKHRRWNHAGDYAINQELVDSGMTMLVWTQGIIDMYAEPMKSKVQGKIGEQYGLLDKAKYNGLTAEQIYDLLEQEKQKGGRGRNKGNNQGQSQGDPDDDDDEGLDDLMDAIKDMTKAEVNQLKDDIKQKIAQAATMARAAGKMPNNLQILVDGVINPPQPWEVILREFMTRMVNSTETWNRRNRRFANVTLPSRYDVGMGELGIVGDTSASMLADKVWAQLATEINHCNEFVKPERTRVVWADHQAAAHEQVFEPNDEVVLEPKGGGGTDMRLPLKHMEQFEPCVVILVTDCYTPWPAEPTPYPLIVAATTQAASPDWAMRLQLRDGSGD